LFSLPLLLLVLKGLRHLMPPEPSGEGVLEGEVRGEDGMEAEAGEDDDENESVRLSTVPRLSGSLGSLKSSSLCVPASSPPEKAARSVSSAALRAENIGKETDRSRCPARSPWWLIRRGDRHACLSPLEASAIAATTVSSSEASSLPSLKSLSSPLSSPPLSSLQPVVSLKEAALLAATEAGRREAEDGGPLNFQACFNRRLRSLKAS